MRMMCAVGGTVVPSAAPACGHALVGTGRRVWILSYSLSYPTSAPSVITVMCGWGEDRRRDEIDSDRDSEDLRGGNGRSWTVVGLMGTSARGGAGPAVRGGARPGRARWRRGRRRSWIGVSSMAVVRPGVNPVGDELQPPSPPAPPPPCPPRCRLYLHEGGNRRRSRRGQDELRDSLGLHRRAAPVTASPRHGGLVPFRHGHAPTRAPLLWLPLARDQGVSWRRLQGVSSWRRSWRLETGARSRGEQGRGNELTPNMRTHIRTPLEESSNLCSGCGGTHCKYHTVSTCASEWFWR
jgi:hypothetical protein